MFPHCWFMGKIVCVIRLELCWEILYWQFIAWHIFSSSFRIIFRKIKIISVKIPQIKEKKKWKKSIKIIKHFLFCFRLFIDLKTSTFFVSFFFPLKKKKCTKCKIYFYFLMSVLTGVENNFAWTLSLQTSSEHSEILFVSLCGFDFIRKSIFILCVLSLFYLKNIWKFRKKTKSKQTSFSLNSDVLIQYIFVVKRNGLLLSMETSLQHIFLKNLWIANFKIYKWINLRICI